MAGVYSPEPAPKPGKSEVSKEIKRVQHAPVPKGDGKGKPGVWPK